MKQAKTMRSITEKAGLYAEALPGVPLMELCGDDCILFENHKCVIGYTDREILIRVSYGLVEICGERLELTCVKKEQIVIRGNIIRISLIK